MNTSISFYAPEQISVLIPDLTTGGGERVTAQMIEELLLRGFTVHLVADTEQESFGDKNVASLRPLRWGNFWLRYVVVLKELFRFDNDTPILVVLTGPIIAVGLLNIFFKKKVIAYEHSDIEALYLNSGIWKKFIRLFALRIAVRSIYRIAVVSEFLRDRYPKVVRCDSEKIKIINNPVTPFLGKLSCIQVDRPERTFTAFIIGRDAKEKRHCEAISLLGNCALVSEIFLVSANCELELDQLSSECRQKLKIFESLADVEYFNVASTFLFSYSSVESYSLVIGEWLASELPIVTVRTEAMLKLWGNFRGAYFIAVDSDSHEIAAILKRMAAGTAENDRPIFQPIHIRKAVDELEGLMFE